VPGPTKIVFAYGLAGQPTLTYHQSRRGLGEITFVPVTPAQDSPPDADVQTYDLLMPSYVIPAQKTTYTCNSFHIPTTEAEGDRHVIRIDPIISPNSTTHAHHLLVHICANSSADSYANIYYNNPGECVSPLGSTTTGCRSLLYGWAVGMGPFIIPEEAGYRMGYGSNGFQFMVIEFHYDNPTLAAGVVDNSGFRIYYTPICVQTTPAPFTSGTWWSRSPRFRLASPPSSRSSPARRPARTNSRTPSTCLAPSCTCTRLARRSGPATTARGSTWARPSASSTSTLTRSRP